MMDRERRLFDQDRRVELKLRLAMKRQEAAQGVPIPQTGRIKPVEQEVVDKLIERVRRL